jgi:hypothetical protein
MKTRHGWSWQAVVVVGLLLVATAVWGAHSGYHKAVDGVSVYFAIVPAEMVRGHPREHPEGVMHGGVPAGENHIMVALFDEKSGERIVRAEVTARVRGKNAPDIEKRLEPMTIAGSLTYGNYFYMVGSGPYQIELRIQVPGRNKPVSMRFEWARS